MGVRSSKRRFDGARLHRSSRRRTRIHLREIAPRRFLAAKDESPVIRAVSVRARRHSRFERVIYRETNERVAFIKAGVMT